MLKPNKLNFHLRILILAFATMGSLKAEPTKIGLLLSDLNIERWNKDKNYFLLKSAELNYITMIGDAKNNQVLQNQQADSMIKAGAKVLVVVPVNAVEAATIVQNAHQKGVKVVAYDRLILNCDLDAYVSYDNEMIGKIMGYYITMRFTKGSIAYIGGPKTDNNSGAIHDGLLESLKNYLTAGTIKLKLDTFVSNWKATEAETIFTTYLKTHTCPDVVFTANDELAKGVINVLDKNGLAGKVQVTGQDADLRACRDIVAGRQTLTIFKPIKVLAERAVLLASGLIGDTPFLTITDVNNGKVEVPSLILFPVPVDIKNLENSVIREGYHTVQDIYSKN